MTYVDKLHARFGFPPPGLNLAEWLAEMESREMRKAMGLPANGLAQGFGAGLITEAMRQKLRDAALQKGKERMEELLKVLRKPMTVDQMIIKTGWSKTTVRRALNRAHNENRVTLAHKKAPQVWQRKLEAAE